MCILNHQSVSVFVIGLTFLIVILCTMFYRWKSRHRTVNFLTVSHLLNRDQDTLIDQGASDRDVTKRICHILLCQRKRSKEHMDETFDLNRFMKPTREKHTEYAFIALFDSFKRVIVTHFHDQKGYAHPLYRNLTEEDRDKFKNPVLVSKVRLSPADLCNIVRDNRYNGVLCGCVATLKNNTTNVKTISTLKCRDWLSEIARRLNIEKPFLKVFHPSKG